MIFGSQLLKKCQTAGRTGRTGVARRLSPERRKDVSLRNAVLWGPLFCADRS